MSKKNKMIVYLLFSKIYFHRQTNNECKFGIHTTKVLSTFENRVPLNKQTNKYTRIFKPITGPVLSVQNAAVIARHTSVKCSARSLLDVTYSIEQYPQREISFTDTLMISQPGECYIACTASNGLNFVKITTIVENVTVVSPEHLRRCTLDQVQKCFKNIEKDFIKKTIPINNKAHKKYCIDKRESFYCYQKLLPCHLDMTYTRLINAFRFYCSGKYGGLRSRKVSVAERFPHLMPSYYVFKRVSTEKSKLEDIAPRNLKLEDEVKIYYCDLIKKAAHVVAEEEYAKAVSNARSAQWVRTFHEALLDISLGNYDEFKLRRTGRAINLSNCSRHRNERKLCEMFKKCADMHIELLRMFNYGYIIVNDKKRFFTKACDKMTMNLCSNTFVSHCNYFVQVLLKPLSDLRFHLCDTESSKTFFRYNPCYIKLIREIRLHDRRMLLLQCSRQLKNGLAQLSKNTKMEKLKKESASCLLAKQYLDCIYQNTHTVCTSHSPADLQRLFAGSAMTDGLDLFYCKMAFVHSSEEYFGAENKSLLVLPCLCVCVCLWFFVWLWLWVFA